MRVDQNDKNAKGSLCVAIPAQNKMATGKKYLNAVHALPVVAAVAALAFFVPRTSNHRDANASAPNAAPAPTVSQREPPRTAEEGLINWAIDRGAQVSFIKFTIRGKTFP